LGVVKGFRAYTLERISGKTSLLGEFLRILSRVISAALDEHQRWKNALAMFDH
jgi:hypothetical protein